MRASKLLSATRSTIESIETTSASFEISVGRDQMVTATPKSTITLAHSPDSDDAFMFYGLATNKLDTGQLHFQHLLKDIQTLNVEATRGTYDVTAISFH